MKIRIPRPLAARTGIRWIAWIGGIAIVGLSIMFRGVWLPATQVWVQQTIASFRSSLDADQSDAESEPTDSQGGHNHGGLAHAESTSLQLSGKALRNLGLTAEFIQPIRITSFRRSMTVPALVVERPGRTRIQVAAPMTGVVTHVHSVPGEAVEPNALLFRIRLTHEDLVKAQTEFLRSLGELDVERREIKRLQAVTRSGAVAGKLLLDRQYARDKLEAVLNAEREALRLHGLSTEQVQQIAEKRRLLRDLQVFVPAPDQHDADDFKLTRGAVQRAAFRIDEAGSMDTPQSAPLILSDLQVHKGQSVEAGATLCILADYGDLYIEGLAFEQDANQIASVAKRNWSVSAVFEGNARRVDDLQIIRLANEVELESRTLRFYVRLPNRIRNDAVDADGRRYVEWQYRIGQRLQLRVPVEEWPDQIVLPVDAVTKEGAEFYVFQQNGDHFDRVAVHVEYRDQESVVIANDGALFPGDVIALRGAHQMQIALKNKAGGAASLHHGHTH